MRITALILSVTGFVAIVAARPQPSLARFQLTLERVDNGWRAHCDSGCSWKELSVACPNDCRVFIDADGVTANVTAPETKSSFGFVLSRADGGRADGGRADGGRANGGRANGSRANRGWQAESVAGTSWKTVSWGCGLLSCRARLDQDGVQTLL